MPDIPLRILQVLRSPVGGLYRHVADLSGELSRRGHKIGLVMDSSLSDAQTEARLAPIRNNLALGIHPMRIPRLLGPSDIAVPLRLRRLIRTLEIDIVHGHGAKGGFHARLARLGAGRVRAIYTPHGGVLHFDPGSLAGRAFLKIEAALLPLSDAIIFESAFARRTYTDRIGAPKCPTPVVHNGLAPSEFEPAGETDNPYDFAFVGELRDLKGILQLVDALAGLKRADGRPVRLILAGDGPERDRLEQAIAAHGLSDQVTLAGVQPARAIFAQGRCMVAPSLAESLPYVVLEAIAAGKPVISTRVGGIPEIFGPTADRLVKPGDSAALQQAMQGFLDAPEAMKMEVESRFQHVRAGFSVERMCDHIEAVYREAIASR